MFPCNFSVITVDNQQDATTLFTSNQLYMFRAMFSPTIRTYHCNYSFWYCLPMLLLAGVANDGRKHRPKHLELIRSK